MLKLYQGNRLESLADLLAAVVSRPLSSALCAETVVVPHPAMGRWLSLRLAERLGVCANIAFPLPAGFLWELFRAVLDEVPEQNPFEPAVLTWRILDLLDELKRHPGFRPVADYLTDDSDLKRVELASRIAETFDQYLLYRPDWIACWEAGRPAVAGDHWQAALWRRLSASRVGPHWVRLQQRLHRALASAAVAERLPERISLFGVGSLSPGYLETLRRLSERTEVHLFLFNPCAAHWTEIVDAGAKARSEAVADGGELYLEVGHPLLASWGRQGRDLFAALLASDPAAITHFDLPDAQHLLGRLQRDILSLRDGTAAPEPLPAPDGSLQFHSCHSAMREVQVLRDQLLEIFRNNPDIEPADVLVMSPAMARYAAYVDAVFSAGDAAAIPYQITGADAGLESPLIGAFFSLLQIDGSRLPSDSVVALLEVCAVRRRFGLAEDDLERIIRWIRESGIRWGRDGAERDQLGLPATDQNSWRAGLDRMLLGYALPDEGGRLFQGVLPYDGIEGSDGAALGGLNDFLEALFDLQGRLQGRYRMEAWGRLLFALLERFFDPSEAELPQLQQLRHGIESLCEQGRCAGFEGEVSVALVRRQLEGRLTAEAAGGGRPGRGVTFSPLASMRGLPARVICLIGMNDGAFPAYRPTPGFDLMAKGFRPGDRVRRADDRYLFLETLLSARRIFYISFTGQNARDNSRLPPSVLVDELLDYLERSHCTDAPGGARGRYLIHHPLQPFSKRYFLPGGGLPSYSRAMHRACCANHAPPAAVVLFLQRALPAPDPLWRQVELAQLSTFFSHPVRYFMQQRLGIYYERETPLLENAEPFSLDYFTGCELRQRLVEEMLAGRPPDRLYARMRASGELPHGRFGERLFARQMCSATRFAERLEPYLETTAERSLTVDVTLEGMRLRGRLTRLSRAGQFDYSVHGIWKKQLLALWIRHLVLNVLHPPDIRRESRWLDDRALHLFSPVASPERHLGALLALYWQGLQRPLRFFPKSSYEYMAQRHKGKTVEAGLQRARKSWSGGHAVKGEGEDPYYDLAFSGEDPFAGDFMESGEQVYRPLLEHLQLT